MRGPGYQLVSYGQPPSLPTVPLPQEQLPSYSPVSKVSSTLGVGLEVHYGTWQ